MLLKPLKALDSVAGKIHKSLRLDSSEHTHLGQGWHLDEVIPLAAAKVNLLGPCEAVCTLLTQ